MVTLPEGHGSSLGSGCVPNETCQGQQGILPAPAGATIPCPGDGDGMGALKSYDVCFFVLKWNQHTFYGCSAQELVL